MAVFQCQLVVDESGGGTFSCIRVDISPTTYLICFFCIQVSFRYSGKLISRAIYCSLLIWASSSNLILEVLEVFPS